MEVVFSLLLVFTTIFFEREQLPNKKQPTNPTTKRQQRHSLQSMLTPWPRRKSWENSCGATVYNSYFPVDHSDTVDGSENQLT